MTRTLTPDSASAPTSGRMSPADGSGDADTPPRPSRGRTATRTALPVADQPLPGQTELPLAYRQVTLWSL
ncbi:hypothetical protein ACFVRD_41190 [Streptomyces sp. NPDC057908]|uniref:hypothetical protein n=1 Tax=Streptomyces sp. NPDC057908 TaxID=3346276 RepID=UPI0036EC0077